MTQSGRVHPPVDPDREVLSGAAGIFLLASNVVSAGILYSIRAGERTLNEISSDLRMNAEAILPGIGSLLRHGILHCRKESGVTYYRLAEKGILDSLDLIRGFSQKKVRIPKAEQVSDGLKKRKSIPKPGAAARRATVPKAK